jgi:XTP/dITP diphosphohydrolase
MEEYEATGYWWGAIADAPRGEGGFGYDPVFVPEGSDLTVAQWPQELKDQASHRALAGRTLLERLRREGLLDGPHGAQELR